MPSPDHPQVSKDQREMFTVAPQWATDCATKYAERIAALLDEALHEAKETARMHGGTPAEHENDALSVLSNAVVIGGVEKVAGIVGEAKGAPYGIALVATMANIDAVCRGRFAGRMVQGQTAGA